MSDQSVTQSAAIERYVRDAITKAGVKAGDLTDEQRMRALDAPSEKAALRGKSLSMWVLEGKNLSEQTKEARATNGSKPRERRSSGKYAPWVRDAVARGRALSEAKDPARKAAGGHIGYAGPIQHIKVRKVIETQVGGDSKVWDSPDGVDHTQIEADKVLELSGVPSVKALRDIATFKSDKPALRPLRELGKEFGNDGWAKGRFLAAILVVLLEDLKKASSS